MIRFWERFADWILLFALVLVSLMVMLTVNQPMIQGLRARALEVSASVEHRLATAGRYMNALDENQRLRDENIRLSSRLALAREAEMENERLRGLLALPDSATGPRVAARVVGKDITRQRNVLVLDVGSRHGIQRGMAVIEPRGLVGVVELVSPNYSRVRSYLNPDFKTSVKIYPSLSDGLLERSPDRPDRLRVLHVSTDDDIRVGHRVVTSGYSQYFRPGIEVGTIDLLTTDESELFWSIQVAPSVPLSSVQHVFVVTQFPDFERIELEEQTEPDA
ncbi:MAG: rod shape-determining protein MreC [Rhodothermales bacterium]|nr:rod shape-determining protein MreC [Rhodothermales bacterium]MBO6779790.1 rod shape-determining protein MreC [Rhodothermales bacterium]